MSYLSVDDMREAIRNHPRYRVSPKWQARVDAMPDKQVMALYFKFVREGAIES